MTVTHFKQVCPHGTIVSQCRCPSVAKFQEVVACPDSCPKKKKFPKKKSTTTTSKH